MRRTTRLAESDDVNHGLRCLDLIGRQQLRGAVPDELGHRTEPNDAVLADQPFYTIKIDSEQPYGNRENYRRLAVEKASICFARDLSKPSNA